MYKLFISLCFLFVDLCDQLLEALAVRNPLLWWTIPGPVTRISPLSHKLLMSGCYIKSTGEESKTKSHFNFAKSNYIFGNYSSPPCSVPGYYYLTFCLCDINHSKESIKWPETWLRVKVLDLRMTTGIRMVEGDSPLLQTILWPTHLCIDTYTGNNYK